MKRLLFLVVITLVLCMLFSACQKICPHKYGDDGVCKICAHVSEDVDKATFTVTFDSDGGSNVRPQTVVEGEKAYEPGTPKKVGYRFDGWYLNGERWLFRQYVVTEDITLTAKWVLASDIPKYWYEPTNLIFQISENSNNQELPSTCGRYLAGNLDDVEDISTIDQWVYDRNDVALRNANVYVKYQYLPDTALYNWGNSIDTIDAEVKSKKPDRPDIYCNYIYDMVVVSLKGSFANLLSTTMYPYGHDLEGVNFFDFADDPDLIDTGDGYMLEYMRSLTLSKDKIYCLASDYFIDLVRAFAVVPVNISLLETLQTEGDYANGKGDFLADRVTTFGPDGNVEKNYTIEDFYQLVMDEEWSYETLAKFSDAIFKEGEDGNESQDLRDTVGFALSTGSDLSASGMLYTSSVLIIDRKYDTGKGDYNYSYPYTAKQVDSYGNVSFTSDGTHEELLAFCDNISDLFSRNGVITVGRNDKYNYGDTELTAIRTRFASGNILFGGVVCLGSLEYNEYKTMNSKGGSGYGIAPVPLYRTNYFDERTGEFEVDKYLTNILSIGKIGAISYTTEKFAQCTAYLNYQSTHSTVILNEYYNYKLQYDIVGTGVKGNVEMLKYIRYNVRTSFDMTFENAIAGYYSPTDANAVNEEWINIIKNADYRIYDMISYYDSLASKKALRLYDLENSVYPTLPD